MSEPEKKKDQAPQSLTDDELNAVAGGKDRQRKNEPYQIYCKECDAYYPSIKFRGPMCPQGHILT